MLVFWKERLVVLATPKTGSTAIEAALESLAAVTVQRPRALKHTNVGSYRAHIAPYLRAASGGEFTVVALMREPRSWLGSWYRDRQRDSLSPDEETTRGLSFDDFVRAHLSAPCPAVADVGSQADFLDAGEAAGVDRLFRYEDIGTFIGFLEDRLDFEIILPRLNVSPAGATDLTAATEARLRAERARDFALYATLT